MTTVSSKIRSSRVSDSSLYRGNISSRYIKERLSKSLGKKGPYSRV